MHAQSYPRIHDRGQHPFILHYRKSRGVEVDLLVQNGLNLTACEVRSGATIQTAFFSNLRQFIQRMETLSPVPRVEARLIHGGRERQRRSDINCIDWRSIHELEWF
jgi:hypothetical protein